MVAPTATHTTRPQRGLRPGMEPVAQQAQLGQPGKLTQQGGLRQADIEQCLPDRGGTQRGIR